MRNIGILVLLLLVISCNSSSVKDAYTFKLSSDLKDGELILSINDKTQILKEDGDIVDFHTSTDQKSIVLEVQMFSTLSILKLYKWDLSSEKYVADTTNINRVAWLNYEQTHSLKTEELESSHVYFLKWKGNDSIAVILWGNTGMGAYISDTVIVKY